MNTGYNPKSRISIVDRFRRASRCQAEELKISDKISESDSFDLDTEDELKLPEDFASRVMKFEMALSKPKVSFGVVEE
jgi:hypothetical protein